MTWRERIVAARERGKFTKQDYVDVSTGETCFVGEVAARYGVEYAELALERAPAFTKTVPPGLTHFTAQPIWVVSANDFDAAERLLDAIEDRALALKRERSEPPVSGDAA